MDLREELSNRSVEFTTTEFPKEVFTSQAVADTLSMSLKQVAKAMLLKVSDGSSVMAVLPGDKRLNLRALSSILHNKKVSLTRREDIKSITDVPVGAITPLIALKDPKIRVFIDAGLIDEAAVNISSGDLSIGITLNPNDLVRIVGATVCSIGE